MIEPIPLSEYPRWVKLSMWGVRGRKGLWKFVTMSVMMAIGCLAAMVAYFAYGFSDSQFFAIGLFLFSAIFLFFLFSSLIYWLTIRWVDRYGTWEADADAESDTITHSAKGFAKRELSGSQRLGQWIMIACTFCWALDVSCNAVLKYQKDIFTVNTVMNLGLLAALLLSLWQGSNFARWAAVGLSVLGLGLSIAGIAWSDLPWKQWIDALSLVTGLSLSAPWVGDYLTALRDHQKLNNGIQENNIAG